MLIVTVGVSGCFLIIAAAFAAVLVALATMNTARLHPEQPAAHGPGQLVERLRYVRRTPRVLTPLLTMALIGAFSYEFQVVLPLLAKRTFHGNADAYGYLTGAFGLGAVAGGIVVAAAGRAGCTRSRSPPAPSASPCLRLLRLRLSRSNCSRSRASARQA